MAKTIRTFPGNSAQDPASIDNLTFNEAAGARKSATVGAHLIPLTYLNTGALAYTTDASTSRAIVPGTALAVYNNDTTVHAITLRESSAGTALASGAVDGSTGDVGVPCAPNAWTYLTSYTESFVITESNKLLVFVIDDDTKVKTEQK